MGAEAALIVVCEAAEAAVGDQRATLDRAARVGVPAHLTVLYPFTLDPTPEEHATLAALFGGASAFTVVGERTGWFGDAVVFVPPADPAPLIALTRAVEAAFPAYPGYGGAFDEVVPHLTIGHDQPVDVLRAAELTVRERLPFTELVDGVELWSGPALATAPPASWRRLRRYRLGVGH